MLAIQGYYDGVAFQPLEEPKALPNQKVIITIMDEFVQKPKMAEAEQFKKKHLNSDTMEAVNEVAYMKKHPQESEGYTDVDLMMEKLLK